VDGCVLSVDKRPKEYIEVEEATKVRLKDDLLMDIGKALKDYDAVDCGLLLCTPSIFDAIQRSIEEGNETLSGGVKNLIKEGKARAFDVGDSFWIDVDTEQDLKAAEKVLCKSLTKPTDGVISKIFNRPISVRISKYLVRTKMKPLQLSFASFFLALASSLFFCAKGYICTAVGGLLAQFSSILDGCDGEVARLRFEESAHGGWVDAVLDRYADAAIIFGLIYGHWSMHQNIWVWVVGFFALLGSFMNSYTADKYEASYRKKAKGLKVRRDLRLFLIMIGALLNQTFYLLMLLCVLTNAASIKRLLSLRD
jgi:CDP-L-myo-inositol myo-inositolphosphotransferase